MDEGNLKRLILQPKLVHSIAVVKQKYINNKFKGALSAPYFLSGRFTLMNFLIVGNRRSAIIYN